jgi:hypothetical protein
MVAYTRYPTDSRVRREAEAPIERGDTVDVICLSEKGALNPEYKSGYGFDNVTLFISGMCSGRHGSRQTAHPFESTCLGKLLP